ncbi:hypothetical protein Q5P01_003329 [Channa striata]|uniref:Uncharacterized protein n=1 Tax=Channa striata TaxID=64152 RepID=A0AA88NFQ6_CHASR|nr:hypothetical protein Q5P01_003329 [Channa striata]
MATASNVLSEDQFQCCICLDVFTDPVTIPCGHNFCKNCIIKHWDIKLQCPMCNRLFDRRPELHVNTFISEIAAQFRQLGFKEIISCSKQQQAKPGEVHCDVCTEIKVKALKSCLVCATSYCKTHLEPHQRISGLKRHKLIDPVQDLEGLMCKKHDKPLELFCKTDQVCVCQFCIESNHNRHHIVSLNCEYEETKAKLGQTEVKIQQMIQERHLKIRELQCSLELSKEDADRELEDSVYIFLNVSQSVEEGLAQLIDRIEKKQITTEKQAKGFIKELETEISELTRRGSELEQLLHTEDHLRFLQTLPSLNSVPPTKDWSEVKVHSSYEGIVRRAVAQLEEKLTKEVKKLVEAELQRAQQFAVNVSLNPDTAYPKLILSDDGKQVAHGDSKQNLPDKPERFKSCFGVLAKQSFASGRFYYEVESINRKGEIMVCPRNGFWTVCLRNGTVYHANTSPPVCLSLRSKPQKVGVFVDYEEGLVSFYDVDAADLIYSFTGCKFTDRLYPYFSPCLNGGGKNSAPLIISPVNNTHLLNE